MGLTAPSYRRSKLSRFRPFCGKFENLYAEICGVWAPHRSDAKRRFPKSSAYAKDEYQIVPEGRPQASPGWSKCELCEHLRNPGA